MQNSSLQRANSSRTNSSRAQSNRTQPTTNYHQQYVLIGQRLQQARLQQRLSLTELHQRTLVSRRLIQSLEAGDTQRFPEEIYLRHLVKRLGMALGMDDITQDLPTSVPLPLIPSWYDPALSCGLRGGLRDRLLTALTNQN
ncbi:MAG: helix-turn-helix domain-containing protein [Cyanobacteria bacterium P01_G01_bin.54]